MLGAMKKYARFCSFLCLLKSFDDFKIMGAIKEQLENNEKTLLPQEIGTDYTFKRKIVWPNAIGFLVLHLLALYGVYRVGKAHWWTGLWGEFGRLSNAP